MSTRVGRVLILPAALVAGLVFEAHAGWVPNGIPLATGPQSRGSPTIVPAGSGGAIVAWSGDGVIYAQRVDSNGVVQWTPGGVTISAGPSAGSPAAQPFLGGAVVVWQEGSVLVNTDLVGQRIDAQGNLLWPASGVPIATTASLEEQPVLVGNASSGILDPIGVYVLWKRRAASSPSDEVQFVLKALNDAGAPIWTPAELVLTPDVVRRGSPALASDGVGAVGRARGVVVSWHEWPEDQSDADIVARRVAPTGSQPWSWPVGNVCDAAHDQIDPAIVQIGTTTVIAWSDARGGFYPQVYAQKLNSSGTAQWDAQGILVCQALGPQFDVHLVTDNAGGVIIAWLDNRAGTSRPYVQRIDADGQRLWRDEGVVLCDVAEGVSGFGMVPDGAGGAIVAWSELRNGGFDLFAQRVGSDGTMLWGLEGVPLCGASGTQSSVRLVRDAGSGAIAAWMDSRSGDSEIYATRAYAATGTVDAPHVTPETAALALQSPNPTRGAVRLRLDLREPAAVSAEVLDVTGRRVRTLLDGVPHGAGTHPVSWDGADEGGRLVPVGVYLVRVRAGARAFTTRIAELR